MRGDDNILARLERDCARQASGNRSRAAWYGAAASLVLLLIAALAWMAVQNARSVLIAPAAASHVDNAPATVVLAPASPTLPPPASRSMPASASASASASTAPPSLPTTSSEGAATISASQPATPAAPAFVPSSQARHDSATGLPPLVLLKQATTTASKPAAAPLVVKPAKPASAAEALASIPAARNNAVVPDTPMALTPIPATRNAARNAINPRARRPAPASVTTEPPVDTDVALLSAIIIHDSAHAAERAQLEAAACARSSDKRCRTRPASGH